MAKTKKDEVVEVVETKPKTTKASNSKTKDDKSTAELEALKEQNKLLMEQMAELQKAMKVQNVVEDKGLTNDTDVTVISLTRGALNLATEGYGQGIIYTFDRLYDEIDIPFEDLKKIVRTNREMAENGRFFITDENAIKKLRLGRFYEHILSPEELKELLHEKPNRVIELYHSVNDAQKEVIKEILIDANFSNEVDKNIIYQFGAEIGVDFGVFIDTNKK